MLGERINRSKYKLVPTLAGVFSELGGRTALDAFSGSGVVGYTLKALGYAVTTNDFLHFPSVIARATIENHTERLTGDEIEAICGPPADDRDFVQRTFDVARPADHGSLCRPNCARDRPHGSILASSDPDLDRSGRAAVIIAMALAVRPRFFTTQHRPAIAGLQAATPPMVPAPLDQWCVT
jgi:hypothetical protein